MNYQDINIIDGKTLYQRLRVNFRLKLLMIASPVGYAAKHIPGSLFLFDVSDAKTMLAKDDEIVVYSASHPQLSIWAYIHLLQTGFDKIQLYEGGLEDWEAMGYELAGVWAKQAA